MRIIFLCCALASASVATATEITPWNSPTVEFGRFPDGTWRARVTFFIPCSPAIPETKNPQSANLGDIFLCGNNTQGGITPSTPWRVDVDDAKSPEEAVSKAKEKLIKFGHDFVQKLQ